MNKLFVVVFVLASFSDALSHDYLCAKIPIIYQSLLKSKPGDVNQAKDQILHRYCTSRRIIDFSKHTQNLTVIINTGSAVDSFFKNPKYGERFLMKDASDPKGNGINITLVPEILDMSPEDSLRYHMHTATITRRNELPIMNNRTYLVAAAGDFYPDSRKEKVHLSPGWIEKLRGKQILTQTLIPSANSTLKEQEVSIVAGWLVIAKNEGIHATATHELNSEYITIFFQKPDLDSAKFNPGHVEVLLKMKDLSGKVEYEPARLVPGWFYELDHITQQTLVFIKPRKHPQLQAFNVTVYPDYHTVKEENGLHATLDLHIGYQLLTVYYNVKNGNPENNPDNRRGMYRNIDIVRQANQSFTDDKAIISPAWVNIPTETTQQTLIPFGSSHSPLVEQNVTVTLGWRKFNDNSGFIAMYRFEKTDYPISVHLEHPPKGN